MSKLTKTQLSFVDKLIKSFDKGQIPWRPTWDQTISKAYNVVSGKPYTGINQLNLFITSLNCNFEDPRWMTFKQANEAGYQVLKGAVGTDIFYFAFRNMETKELIASNEYNDLDDEEKKKIAIVSKSYRVFNAAQLKGIPPIDLKKESVIFENDKAAQFSKILQENMKIDITHGGNRAYYNPSQDCIVLPQKDTFMDEQSYYAVRLHESAHATMHSSRLDRDAHGVKGSEKYAIEELRAELTSAFMTLDIGFHFDQIHEENHTAYIQSWKNVLKDHPHALFSAISDAQKIREYMLDKGEYEKIYNVINLCEVQQNEKEANAAREEHTTQENWDKESKHSFQNSSNERNTVVINLFAGPGAGKTTCSWEIASELKKMGYVTEYVPEYAKELVWDDKRDLLDGTLEHQQMLLNEQEHRVDRLLGKVDFVVTDAPSLLNYNFLKCDDKTQAQQYKNQIIDHFEKNNNFNLFINRGDTYETLGRIHTLEESIVLDESIKDLLNENHIFYGTYDHKSIDQVIKNCITTHERINTNHRGVNKEQVQVTLEDMKNSVSIAEYAQNVLGFGLIKEPKGRFRLDEHDSCKIFPNNTFVRFSLGVKGSIIDFIKHFENCDTKEAIHKMSDYYYKYHPEKAFDTHSHSTSEERFKVNVDGIEVPEKGETNKHVYAYLTKTRGIKPSVVNDYLKRNILYEDINRNCVFLGKLDKKVFYANLRGTGTKAFKQDAPGSIKEVGVYFDNHSDTLVVNEAVIDQMSYMSMTEDPTKFNYLSVCGASNVVNAIKFHMVKRSEASNIKRVIIGLDNDEAGEVNAQKALDFLKEKYPDIETMIHIPDAKDFNEQLKNEMDLLAQTAPCNDIALGST